jgi:hypothetical protein
VNQECKGKFEWEVLTCEPTEMQVLLVFLMYQSAQQTLTNKLGLLYLHLFIV